MAKENRINELRDMITASQQGYDRYSPVFKKMLNMYLLKLDAKTIESLQRRGKSHLYFPVVNGKIKRITNAFQEAYFSSNTFVKITPHDNEDVQKSEAVQKATDHYLNRINLFEVMQEIFLYAPMIGTVIAKSYWDSDKDRVSIEFKPLRDVRFDPSARTWDDVRYIVEDVYLTRDDIKRMQRQGVFGRKFKADDLQSTDERGNTDKFERIKLQEVYTLTGNGIWTVSTIYDESIMLRADVKLSDGHPFSRGVLLPQVEDENETTAVLIYGEPIMAASSSLQDEMNIRRNQQIDAIKRLLDPKLIIDRNSGINPLDIAHPTKPILAKDAGGVVPVPAPSIQASIFDVQEIDSDISENTGVSPQQNGVGPNKKMTATESSIVSNEGNMRLQSYIRSLNETLIEPLMERVAKLVWKYGDAKFFMGHNRQEDFKCVAKVNTGLGATNKEIQMNGLAQSFEVIGTLQQMAGAAQDMDTIQECVNAARNIIRELLPLNGIEDVDSYFRERNKDELGTATGANGYTGTDGSAGQGVAAGASGLAEQYGMAGYPTEIVGG